MAAGAAADGAAYEFLPASGTGLRGPAGRGSGFGGLNPGEQFAAVVEQSNRVGCQSVAESLRESPRDHAGSCERCRIALLLGFRGGVEELNERPRRGAAVLDVLFDLGEFVPQGGHHSSSRGSARRTRLNHGLERQRRSTTATSGHLFIR